MCTYYSEHFGLTCEILTGITHALLWVPKAYATTCHNHRYYYFLSGMSTHAVVVILCHVWESRLGYSEITSYKYIYTHIPIPRLSPTSSIFVLHTWFVCIKQREEEGESQEMDKAVFHSFLSYNKWCNITGQHAHTHTHTYVLHYQETRINDLRRGGGEGGLDQWTENPIIRDKLGRARNPNNPYLLHKLNSYLRGGLICLLIRPSGTK